MSGEWTERLNASTLAKMCVGVITCGCCHVDLVHILRCTCIDLNRIWRKLNLNRQADNAESEIIKMDLEECLLMVLGRKSILEWTWKNADVNWQIEIILEMET